MNQIKNSKLTRVVSTKITVEEFNYLMRIAGLYLSQGYIDKANPAEILRFILRLYMQYLHSHKSTPKEMDVKTTQSDLRVWRNPIMTSLGKSSASAVDK